jgi:hypothetical protein
MTDRKKSILLRIPPDLWDSLNRWARDEIRSVNAQIEYLLRDAVRRRAGQPEIPGAANPCAEDEENDQSPPREPG